MAWPPTTEQLEQGPPEDARAPSWPPDGWPRKSQVDYASAIILLGLLLLALPWLVIKLLTNPEEVFATAGKRAIVKGGP